MAKVKKAYFCKECGYEAPKWMGRCPACGEWNTFTEEIVARESGSVPAAMTSALPRSTPQRVGEIRSNDRPRLDLGNAEVNRVLGGGLVPGSLVLLGGEPGIGKSTLSLQIALADNGLKTLYVSGEESAEQIKMRADRIGIGNDACMVYSETLLENIMAQLEEQRPDLVIIDSIQTMYSNQLDSAPGSVSQVRMCGNQLMKLGKTKNLPIFIVAHVTKSGDLAGPKTVEHLVDCVLNFTGERDQELRVMRAYKNRFGTTSEIGAFRMEAEGLIEVRDISASFLENREDKTQGSVTTAIYEGSRPVMFEMQALVSPANVGFARRTAVGVDNTRLNMILAVLEKIVGMPLGNQDVYVNVVGGIRPEGTGADLAAALAIYSSFKNITARKRTLAMGEIGLTGDLRSVQNAEKIIKEAARLGYEQVILPKRNAQKVGGSLDGCRVIGVKNIQEAIRVFSM